MNDYMVTAWTGTILAIIWGAGCVYLNGERLKWKREAERLERADLKRRSDMALRLENGEVLKAQLRNIDFSSYRNSPR